MTLSFDITELNRRLANLIRLGTVIETRYSQVVPRVKVRIGPLQTAWLPVLTSRAGQDRSWWPLEPGEQVVVLSVSGELTQGVVLGAVNQTAMPAPAQQTHVHRQVYADGAVLEYDRQAHHLMAQLPAGGRVTLSANGGITVTGSMTIHGDVQIQGDVQASGDVADGVRSMQADRAVYNRHTHAGVSTGRSKTLIPDPTQ